jgi:hypothetical protein
MWRDYYDKNPTRLYWDTVSLLRTQQGFPLVRAMVSAYWAGKAAFVFKEGHQRPDYVRALPYLESYYRAVVRTGQLKSDPKRLAELELEWWIIHRERGAHGESALVRALAETAGELYQIDPNRLVPYALPRARAMIERSRRDRNMNEADWKEVETSLSTAYRALAIELAKVGT